VAEGPDEAPGSRGWRLRSSLLVIAVGVAGCGNEPTEELYTLTVNEDGYDTTPASEQATGAPRRLRVLFTSDPGTPLRELAGPDYTAAIQASFDRRGYVMVDEMARSFGTR
jgi:hypothetical protein